MEAADVSMVVKALDSGFVPVSYSLNHQDTLAWTSYHLHCLALLSIAKRECFLSFWEVIIDLGLPLAGIIELYTQRSLSKFSALTTLTTLY